MIEVTRLDDSKVHVNEELIQSLQASPDTIITFTTREKIIVKEEVEEICKKIFEYQRLVRSGIGYSSQDQNRLSLAYDKNDHERMFA